MKTAIVHDWLVSYRGGEKVLKAICELYPDAPIYTLFYDRNCLPEFFLGREVRYPKFLNTFRSFRKFLLPIYPFVIESFDLDEFDLVISTSSCVAKGVVTRPDSVHISYIHSPMRYIWDQRFSYFKSFYRLLLLSSVVHLLSSLLRVWDVSSSQRITKIIANSSFVSRRIKAFYNKDSQVIHPPLGMSGLEPSSDGDKQDYFLVAGAMVPYKKFDIAIQACIQEKKKVIVAGDGPEWDRLVQFQSPHVEFVKNPTNTQLIKLMREAKALIFPAVEDFGMIAIESIACGTPVVAFSKGGARDFIIENKTGIFFHEQNVNSLANALTQFSELSFDQNVMHEFSKKFSLNQFKQKFKATVDEALRGVE